MPSIDLNAIPPARRAALAKVGRHFGSIDTLAQAEQTLRALGTHRAALAAQGFGAADESRLTDARDTLRDAGVGREAARTGRKERVSCSRSLFGPPRALASRLAPFSPTFATRSQ